MYNDLFETLASDNGRNFKLDLLNKHKNDELLQEIVNLALNPFIQFYIRKIPKYTPNNNPIGDNLDWGLDQLATMLATRKVTGNDAIEHLQYVLENVSADNAKVLERVIQKDLKCGVSEATINAVWPYLIPEYPCMLASAYDQKLIDKIKMPAYVQLKLDGMRFNAIVRNGAVEFRSRNGKEINIADPLFGLPFIAMAGAYGNNCVFDGELLVVGDAALIYSTVGNTLDRKTGNGILNKALKGTQSADEGRRVRATLWDVIPLSAFEQGLDKTPYEARLKALRKCIDSLDPSISNLVSFVPHHEVQDMDAARKLFNAYLQEGLEGIILKSHDMAWENKRSKQQVKFKSELECDLKCVGWEEGTGKNAGRLGALVLESADGVVQVNVGTGFTDEDRDTLTKKKTVGRIVTIKYNARITDKRTNVDSLFLPVFLELREDKDKAEHSKSIK